LVPSKEAIPLARSLLDSRREESIRKRGNYFSTNICKITSFDYTYAGDELKKGNILLLLFNSKPSPEKF
jgi:hypothetical protein